MTKMFFVHESHGPRVYPVRKSILRILCTNLAHTTTDPFVTIYYPYHPFAGRCLRCYRIYAGPPKAYLVQLPKRRVSVPAWMTEEKAAHLKIQDFPSVDISNLLSIADILMGFLPGQESCSSLLDEKTHSRKEHDHGPFNPAKASLGSTRGRDSSSSRGSKRACRSHGTSSPRGSKS